MDLFNQLEVERLRKLNKTKDNEKTLDNTPWYLFGGSLAILFLVIMTAYNLFAVGFTGMKMWQWFVVPSLNVPQIGLLHMMGVVLLLRLFTYHLVPKTQKSDETTKDRVMTFIGLLLIPWYILLVGYVVHCFI